VDAAAIESQNPRMARKSKTANASDGSKRNRRTPEQLIKDLEAKIEEVKQRAAAKRVKASGEGKALVTAVKALDKALASSTGDTQRAIEAARAILAERLAEMGLGAGAGGASKGERVRRSTEDLEELAASIRAHVQANPGARLEEISADIDVPSKDLKRPVQLLLGNGELRTEGQKRGTRYFLGSGEVAAKSRPANKTASSKATGKKRRSTR
jgi:hypothetical protein